MLIEAEKRGNHATGFAIIDSSSEFLIHKAPNPATDFVNSEDTVSALDLVDGTTSIIMGHTRFGTLGSRHNNANNHPIRTRSVIGTHNGSVQNHKSLFKQFKMKRFAQVDREVLFRLFATAKDIKDFVVNRLPKVRGRVSMVWADTKNPNIVYLYKGNNPLECYYSREYDAFIYGSTVNTVRKSGISGLKEVPIKANTLVRIDTRTLKYKVSSVKILQPKYSNRIYNHKIGAYQRKVRNPRFTPTKRFTFDRNYEETVDNFVPRFSYRDQLEMFKASDGSTIKKIKG